MIPILPRPTKLRMTEMNNGVEALNRAPPLTVGNILKALEGVKDWKVVADWLGTLDSSSFKNAVEGFLKGQGHFQPSWRAVIVALDGAEEIPVASRIMSYGEPVQGQDPTLTTDSVAEVMDLMNKWDSLDSDAFLKTVIPRMRVREIQQMCSTKREIVNKCASYYVHCHPQPSWTHLATQLYIKGEFAAMGKLKPFLPLRDLTITTEKLVELFATMDDKHVRLGGGLIPFFKLNDWLDLPESKVAEMKNLHSPSQRREAYLDLYATGHPCPSWRQVAKALYHVHLDHQADIVESTYIQVSERAQHNFDEAMKEGGSNFRSGSSFLMGAGGSGKTHVLHAFLKEKPPPIRQSTECVKNPVRAVAQCKLGIRKEIAGETHFTRITDQQYSDMLCESAKHSQLLHRGKQSPQPHTRRLEGDEAAVAHISAGDFNVLPPVQNVESAVTDITKKLEHSGLERELVVRMHAGSKAACQLDDQDVIDMGDSGGQPTYHEILPVFVSNTMFGILTVKLNEPLDSYPLVEYYTSGKPIGKPFKSPFTHLQTFRHCMRVLQSTCKSGKCPKIAFVGMHKDLEDECKGENRAEKERKLLSIIPPNMRDHVLFCDEESQRLIFAINAKCPGDDDQAVLADLRYLILQRSNQIPLYKRIF